MASNTASSIQFTSRRELMRMRAEIERLRDENERLSALAYRDALTGLRNRRHFNERLHEELCRLRRHPAAAMSVLCIDLNGFKTLNDTQGHSAGDDALIAVARLLETLTRTEDTVCRLGGDEFAVLLPDTSNERAQVVVDRIRDHAHELMKTGLGPRPLALGLASWELGDDDVRLLSRADDAMYADKRNAKGERFDEAA